VTPCERFDSAEDVRRATAYILIVLAPFFARTARTTGTGGIEQLHRPLVKTHVGLSGVVGLLVEREEVLHPSDELGVEFGDAPHFFSATV
jgi:hypothetical protein